MKELLYLKDIQLKDLIEKLFTGYRESFSDARKVLDKHSIGIAHHKVLHLLSMYKGITISELLNKLKITKQSLNRVLKDLIKRETIFFNTLSKFKTCSELEFKRALCNLFFCTEKISSKISFPLSFKKICLTLVSCWSCLKKIV